MKSAVQLRKALNHKFHNQFELDVGAGDFVLLTVISPLFQGKARNQRLLQIEPLIEEAGLVSGIIELYTPEEATNEGITIQTTSENNPPASWQEAIAMLSSGKTVSSKKPKHSIKRVVFYSYKGGVGRTTALIQTAFQLTRAGKRVVLIDMDVEAPGLQALLPPTDMPLEEGLIDYLWERQTCFFDDNHKATIHLSGSNQGKRTGIIYSVNDPQSRRDLFIVPAGKIGQRYIQRLSVLSTAHLFSSTTDPWHQFEQELWEQFEPDIMLIDARTGLNEWGGLSLLRLADEAFIALYPSKQNAEGVCFIRNLLKELSGIQAKLVLSPIPEGLIGDSLVKSIKPHLDLFEGEEPVSIPYHPSIAGSYHFPVESALSYYAPLANNLLEISGVEETAAILAESSRLALIESLSFPERDAASISEDNFDAIFQKTADFERCLEDQVWVIRGRKGTGKSTLYTLFTKHRKNAEKRSQGRLDNVQIMSGHGDSSTFRPTADIFETIQKKLNDKNVDWLSLWRAYAVIRIYQSHEDFIEILKQAKLSTLITRLTNNFDPIKYEQWSSLHTNKLLEFATDASLNGYCRDAITQLNSYLKKNNKKLWLLYDDLDQDIQENSPWQQEALGGLLRLVYDTNNQNLYQIRFKIFLREDIWSNLVFTNKSHFGEERTLILQWGKEDFFRLAYRLAVGGSPKFKSFANRILPLADNELDESDEDTLRQALSPLWGLRQKSKNAYVAQWVYSRLTDSSGNTYPRSLTILLKKAKEVELAQKQGKYAPNDHLLRWASLTDGLDAASIERCDAIRNEYPDLSEFFNKIGTLKSLFKEEELKDIWQKTIANSEPPLAFDTFVKRLKDIGLLESKKYSQYDYAIANLYIHGFGVTRKQGQRK